MITHASTGSSINFHKKFVIRNKKVTKIKPEIKNNQGNNNNKHKITISKSKEELTKFKKKTSNDLSIDLIEKEIVPKIMPKKHYFTRRSNNNTSSITNCSTQTQDNLMKSSFKSYSSLFSIKNDKVSPSSKKNDSSRGKIDTLNNSKNQIQKNKKIRIITLNKNSIKSKNQLLIGKLGKERLCVKSPINFYNKRPAVKMNPLKTDIYKNNRGVISFHKMFSSKNYLKNDNSFSFSKINNNKDLRKISPITYRMKNNEENKKINISSSSQKQIKINTLFNAKPFQNNFFKNPCKNKNSILSKYRVRKKKTGRIIFIYNKNPETIFLNSNNENYEKTRQLAYKTDINDSKVNNIKLIT